MSELPSTNRPQSQGQHDRLELDQLLTELDVVVESIAVSEIANGVAMVFEPREEIVIHHVVSGSGVLQVIGSAPITFRPGSMLLVPAQCALQIGTCPDPTRVLAAQHHSRTDETGLFRMDGTLGASADLTAICSVLHATWGPLACFNNLAGPLVEDMSDIPAVRVAFDAMLAEQARADVCSVALIASLMKQCLLLFIRRRFSAQDECLLPVLLRDERLARVVGVILDHPGEILRMDDLAASAGLNRSAFTKRFVEAVHMTPMEFVRRTRLKRAADLLVATDLPIKTIAADSGYASRSQFCRAFRGAFHLHPSEYRRSTAQSRTAAKPQIHTERPQSTPRHPDAPARS